MRRHDPIRRFLAVVMLAGPSLVPGAGAQVHQPQPPSVVFRSRVDLIQTDVFVQDQKGQFVEGLGAADFELLEDGTPQTVSTCVLMGTTGTSSQTAGTGHESNRLYILVLDDLQTHPSAVPAVRQAASRFVEHYMEDGDVGAVVFASGVERLAQAFTSDRRRLLAAVARFSGSRAGGPAAMTDSLTALAAYLAGMRDTRKTAVFFGPGALGPRRTFAQNLVDVSNRAMLTFYVVNPVASSDRATVVTATEPSKVQGEERLSTSAKFDALDARERAQQWLAFETGGFAVAGTHDVDRALARIRDEATRYYVLGYSRATPPVAGASHALTIRVKRPDLTVRGRRAFRVPTDEEVRRSFRLTANNVPPALLQGLEYPARQRSLRFETRVTVDSTTDPAAPTAVVALTVNVRDLALSDRVQVDYAVLAVGDDGRILGHDVRRAEAAVTDGTRPRLLEAGLRLESRVRVGQGTCTLRIALVDPATGRTGSSWTDVVVPPTSRP